MIIMLSGHKSPEASPSVLCDPVMTETDGTGQTAETGYNGSFN